MGQTLGPWLLLRHREVRTEGPGSPGEMEQSGQAQVGTMHSTSQEPPTCPACPRALCLYYVP